MFIIFIKANKWSNRNVNFISKSVWGGYLSNSFIINALKVFIFRDYNENYVSLYVIGLNIVLTFLIIIIVDNFFMLVLRPILTVIRKIIGTYQYSIEGFMEDENEKK